MPPIPAPKSPPRTRPLPRILAAAGIAVLAAAGCGRRGALEPPQVAAAAVPAPAQGPGMAVGGRTLPVDVGLGGGVPEPNPEAVRAGDELSVAAVPPAGTEAPVQTGRGAKRGYRIPREPFILDPLL